MEVRVEKKQSAVCLPCLVLACDFFFFAYINVIDYFVTYVSFIFHSKVVYLNTSIKKNPENVFVYVVFENGFVFFQFYFTNSL